MVGGVLPVVPVTWIENAGREAEALPFETPITMLLYVPTSPADGWPESWPVPESRDAQDGELVAVKVSAPPLDPDTVGVKLYEPFAATLVAGVPEIVKMVAPAGGRTLLSAPEPPQPLSAIENVRAHAIQPNRPILATSESIRMTSSKAVPHELRSCLSAQCAATKVNCDQLISDKNAPQLSVKLDMPPRGRYGEARHKDSVSCVAIFPAA